MQELPGGENHGQLTAPASRATNVPALAHVLALGLRLFSLPFSLIVSLLLRTLSMATQPPGIQLSSVGIGQLYCGVHLL